MRTKIILAYLLMLTVLLCGCEYTKETDNGNFASPDEIELTKQISEEDAEEILRDCKYPKAYIKKLGDSFYVPTALEAVIKDVKVLNSVEGLDENDFSQFNEEIKPCLNSDKTLKKYDRRKYESINGGLETKTLGVDKNIQLEFLLVDLEITNNGKEEIGYFSVTPQLSYAKYKEFDEQLLIDENGGVYYENADDEMRSIPSSEPVYFPQSQNKNNSNWVTRAKKFFVYNLKPNETLKCTVGYVIDSELKDGLYASFVTGGKFSTQVKLF